LKRTCWRKSTWTRPRACPPTKRSDGAPNSRPRTRGPRRPEAVAELSKATSLDPKFERAGEKLREVFWSLDPGNTWDYHVEVKIPIIGKTKIDATRRATGEIDWKGRKVYAYQRGGRSSFKGGATTLFIGSEGKVDRTNYYVKTPEGIAWAGYEMIHRAKALFVHTQSKNTAVYDPPLTLFPYNAEAGWERKAEIRVTKSARLWKVKRDGTLKPTRKWDPETNVETVVVRSLGVEKISVPAGVFDAQAYRVESDGDLGEAGREITFWFAPGIGLVKTDGDAGKYSYVETLEGYSLKP
jgi:hypothetical protein